MKVAVLCRSDQTGGAAVTSRRLTEALNANGLQATLLVVKSASDSSFVIKTGSPLRENYSFLKERLHIFIANGFSRDSLFKIDTGEEGLPLWKNPVVREADAVIINWVNQGMLSLDGVRKICRAGKKVVWTMHDMWNFTGICHHAMDCKHYLRECGDCPLLGSKASPSDLSRKVWRKKNSLYSDTDIKFVAVSSWLEDCAKHSSLLKDRSVTLIPNAFPAEDAGTADIPERNPIRILFVAARLDDPIKGIDTLRDAMRVLAEKHPQTAKKIELQLIGEIRDNNLLKDFSVKTLWRGSINDPNQLKKTYKSSGIVVSTSLFENLPGTLVEGQAYGCIPVAFDRGGQKDIIAHLATGYLSQWHADPRIRAGAIAEGIVWALEQPEDIRDRMNISVKEKFGYEKVASQYKDLIST